MFTPRRYRSPEIRAYVPYRWSGAFTASNSSTTCLEFAAWIDPLSRAELFSGNKAVLSRLKAGKKKKKKSCLCVFRMGEQNHLNLVPGWEVCQPACLEWQVGCVTQHCPTCICFTSESVLLHLN